MPRVLLIEDDPGVREGARLASRRQGHDVAAAETGEEGLVQLRSFRPDVVVLDLMLPGMSGLEACRRIRTDSQVPIIMVTAKGDDVDIVVGLETGADDYVVKPVQARVLEARIRAVLRRLEAGPSPDGGGPATETYGELRIDQAGLSVTCRGDAVPLAPSELRLLLTLSASPAGCSAVSNSWRPSGNTATTATFGWWMPASNGCGPSWASPRGNRATSRPSGASATSSTAPGDGTVVPTHVAAPPTAHPTSPSRPVERTWRRSRPRLPRPTPRGSGGCWSPITV